MSGFFNEKTGFVGALSLFSLPEEDCSVGLKYSKNMDSALSFEGDD